MNQTQNQTQNQNQPVKFINHEVADTLDSSDAFEGPEKLLEISFQKTSASRGFLSVSSEVWESMLDLVHCKVLSTLAYDNMVSYVLSESSFFVYENKLILKTCGTTTLLEGLPRILEIAKNIGDLQFSGVNYSRRGFLFPNQQPFPYRNWHDEVAVLKSFFPYGTSQELGIENHEKWFLFTATAPATANANATAECADEIATGCNLQIMMCGLDAKLTKLFHLPETTVSQEQFDTCEDSHTSSYPSPSSMEASFSSFVGAKPDNDDPGHALGNAMTGATRIDEIYPLKTGQTIDSFAFTPCGYSCNGILYGKDYFTIHVTPEDGFSYASFETSVDPKQFNLHHNDIIRKVLDIFRPHEFTLVVADNFLNHKELIVNSKCTSHAEFVAAGRKTSYGSYRGCP